MIKVLIVDDSLTVRKRISEIVEDDPALAVAGEAKNGREAFDLVKDRSPDVIIMDMVMPIMDGQEATELIMGYYPTPIIIHSSAANRGEDYKTMDALSAGALDFVEKEIEDWKEEMLFRIKRASRIKVVTHLRKKMAQSEKTGDTFTVQETQNKYNILVMGASTGGPKVALDILCRLPGNYPIPIVLVIHMAASFQDSLRKWLNNNSRLKVKIPEGGEFLHGKRGIVYLAPPGKHLIVENGKFQLISTPDVNFCRPSIDILFKSVAKNSQLKTIGVLLTGMGKDGAQGLKAIKEGGGYTIAQDKNTSIVFGMPREAIKIGAATIVLPDSKIPAEITRLMGIR